MCERGQQLIFRRYLPDRIAQLVEQETFNLQVVGSIPTPVIEKHWDDRAFACGSRMGRSRRQQSDAGEHLLTSIAPTSTCFAFTPCGPGTP